MSVDVILRCDASQTLGWGHAVRCAALAAGLRENAVESLIVSRELTDGVRRICDRHRIHYRLLEDFSLIEPVFLPDTDATGLMEIASASHARMIIVDHYGAREPYFAHLAGSGCLVGAIDDTGERDLTHLDWLLTPSLQVNRAPALSSDGIHHLSGAEYIPLRPEFAHAHDRFSRQFSSEDLRVLVILGGGDAVAIRHAVLDGLDATARPLNIQCVAPGAASASISYRHRVELLREMSNVIPTYEAADVAITAAGSTSWELCCLGVPMIAMPLADNQRPVASTLVEWGCAVGCDPENMPALASTVEKLLADPDRRARMSAFGRRRIDGRGARRAAASIASMVAAA